MQMCRTDRYLFLDIHVYLKKHAFDIMIDDDDNNDLIDIYLLQLLTLWNISYSQNIY